MCWKEGQGVAGRGGESQGLSKQRIAGEGENDVKQVRGLAVLGLFAAPVT